MPRTAALLDNLLGRSDSLTPASRAIGIRRQGNGHLAVTVFTEWTDGHRGQSDIARNVRCLDEARAFATAQATTLGIGRVVVLSSAAA